MLWGKISDTDCDVIDRALFARLVYEVTDLTEQKSASDSQKKKILCLSQNQKANFCVIESIQPGPIIYQLNPVHTVTIIISNSSGNYTVHVWISQVVFCYVIASGF
jgi:hypothetical protein